MFWSEVEGCYVLYARHMVSDARIRSTARGTSTDFLNWTEQTPMAFSDTDSNHPPSQHLYTNQTHPYFRAPHIYISLPGRIHFNRSALTEAQAAAVCPESNQWWWGRHFGWGVVDHAGGHNALRLHLQREFRPSGNWLQQLDIADELSCAWCCANWGRARCLSMSSEITISRRRTSIV